MASLRSKSKDIVELFGYEPDDLSVEARSLWKLEACPFTSKVCSKSNHDKTVIYGTCSVTSSAGNCIICPNRLYENKYETLKAVSRDVFGDELEVLMFDEYIGRRTEAGPFIVALGQNSGREVKIARSLSMDWILAKLNKGKLVEYVGIEVQSIDITGNYRDAWYAYKNLQAGNLNKFPSSAHGLNWANVHKRLIPQIIRKGLVYSKSDKVKSGIYFIVPEIVYQKFEEIIGADIPLLNKAGSDVVTIHTYDLSDSRGHGLQRTLIANRKIRFSLAEFSERFITGPNLPSGAELDNAVKNVLGCK